MILHLHWLLLEFTQRRGGGAAANLLQRALWRGRPSVSTLCIDGDEHLWWYTVHGIELSSLANKTERRPCPALQQSMKHTIARLATIFSFLLLPSLLFIRHRSSLFLSLPLPFFFLLLASPSLFLTLHCLFSDSKMWGSLYLDAPLLSPWFLSLYLTSFFFFFFPCRWRTDSQKRSKIHQCCIVAAFWSAWWVTTQPRAIIYKCVFINTRSIYM